MLNQGKKKRNEEQQKGNGKHGTRKSHKTILFVSGALWTLLLQFTYIYHMHMHLCVCKCG